MNEEDALRKDFRVAMRRLAATVCIVSTQDEFGRFGITATAVTSISLDPPSLLISINQSSSIHGPLRKAETFCVNLLGDGQEEHCSTFSGNANGEARFSTGRWGAALGVPYLLDAQASVFCEVEKTVSYGTHTIFIGRVEHVIVADTVLPLVYLNGDFLSYRGETKRKILADK